MTKGKKMLSLRIPNELWAEIEELADEMRANGTQVGRVSASAVALHAMGIGVRELQKTHPLASNDEQVKKRQPNRPPPKRTPVKLKNTGRT